jgi:LPS sulfotransferase NodH
LAESLSKLPLHFIIAAPRSGTTWLANTLNHHPQIVGCEQRLFGDYCAVYPNPGGGSSPRQTVDSFARHYSYHLRTSFPDQAPREFTQRFQRELLSFLLDFTRRQAGKPVIVDKITPYPGTVQQVCQRIAQHFPAARVIHLVRDGRDVMTSGVFDWINRGATAQQSPRYQHYVAGTGPRPARFFDSADGEQWGPLWSEIQAALATPPLPTLRVHYEAMLADQVTEVERILEFLEMPTPREEIQRMVAAASFEQTTGRARGQADPTAKARKGVAGDWRNYFTQQDAREFVAHCGPWLVHYGYEPDEQWVERCPASLC